MVIVFFPSRAMLIEHADLEKGSVGVVFLFVEMDSSSLSNEVLY